MASKRAVASTSVAEKQTSSLTKNLLPKKAPTFSSLPLTKQPLKSSTGSFKGVIPKKPWPSSDSVPSKPSAPPGSSLPKKPVASSSLGAGLKRPAPSSVPTASGSSQVKVSAIPIQSQPNSQIRQNIRRSLKEILWKRWEFRTLVLYRKLCLEVNI